MIIKIGFAGSRALLQLMLFIQIYYISKYSTSSEVKIWLNCVFAASIITIILTGERYLDGKYNWAKKEGHNSASIYASWPILINILILSSILPMLQLGDAIPILLIIVATEVTYTDITRILILREKYIESIIINSTRAATQAIPLILYELGIKQNLVSLIIFGYIATSALTIIYSSIRYNLKFAHITININRSYNIRFTIAAIIARSPYVTDKLIVSAFTESQLASKYAIISGMASVSISILDNLIFQPNLSKIASSNDAYLKTIEQYIKYTHSILILQIAVTIFYRADQIHTTENYLNMIETTITYLNFLSSYLLLILTNYQNSIKRNPHKIYSINTISVVLFYIILTSSTHQNHSTNDLSLFFVISIIIATLYSSKITSKLK